MAHLQRVGIETRYNRLEGRLEEAAGLYAQGWSLARVGDQLGVSTRTVANAFRSAGMVTRPVGTNQWSRGRSRH
jgi:DNA-binding NarL/FixJ family response regulator